MEDYGQAIFNNSAIPRQSSNKPQVEIFYLKMESMLANFNAHFIHEIKRYPKQVTHWVLQKNVIHPFLHFSINIYFLFGICVLG